MDTRSNVRDCILRPPHLAPPASPGFLHSLQSSVNLLPSIEVVGEVTRLIGETIECDQLLVRVHQTASLPATLRPRDPEVRMNSVSCAAMNRSESAQKFGRGNDDEAGL